MNFGVVLCQNLVKKKKMDDKAHKKWCLEEQNLLSYENKPYGFMEDRTALQKIW